MQVLIVGAGVAGPVAAMALQQAGIEARVVEAYPRRDGDVGSHFNIAPNGLRALDTVGALALAKSAGFPTRQNAMWNERGHLLGTLSLGRALPDGTAAQTMRRSRLTQLLTDEALRRGIPVDFGRRLTGATPGRAGRVVATFDDGTGVEADLLVGADGVHSVVRRLIDPAAPRGRYVGLTNFGGVTSGVRLSAAPETWHLVFGRHAFFGYHISAPDHVVWFANVPRDPISVEERESTSHDGWRAKLVRMFADDDSPATLLINQGSFDLVADNTHDLPHVPHWRRGPMVIIGDAAHAPAPTSGQGASMAMEDGIVLAQALRDSPGIGAALASYEGLRRRRVERIVAMGARGSNYKSPGRIGRMVRDAMLRAVFRFAMTEKSLGWLYDYRVAWNTPIPAGDIVKS
jgi:2-polyprenyl-6-methoxyphenol hydroxylase-like FAD-dependent oxidoreductase